MKSKFILFHIILPLVNGGATYLFFRNGNQYFFRWFHMQPSEEPFYIPSIIKYNLVDGLWLYSLLKTIEFIWKKDSRTKMFAWFGIATTIAVMSEWLQKWKIIPGTFDRVDVVTYLLVLCLCLYQNKFNPYTLTLKTNLQ